MTDFADRRRMMVDTQIRPADVTKYPIIEALLAIPRENFVPDSQSEVAYADQSVPLSDGRVVPEPRTLAKMLDALDVRQDELVLDVACGLGYSTAVVARLAQMVIGVEEDESLAAEAQEVFSYGTQVSRQGCKVKRFVCGGEASVHQVREKLHVTGSADGKRLASWCSKEQYRKRRQEELGEELGSGVGVPYL